MARKYVWIVTKCEDGKTATVAWHAKTAEDAKSVSEGLEFGSYEGPVPLDMYPIGKTFAVESAKA